MQNIFKVNNKDINGQCRRPGVFVVNFEHILHLVVVLLLLTLSMLLPAGECVIKNMQSYKFSLKAHSKV